MLLVDDQPVVGGGGPSDAGGRAGGRVPLLPGPNRGDPDGQRVSADCILQDLVMPEVDGLLLAKFFRADPATGAPR